MNLQDKLIQLQPTQEFFIGFDSDGCVFDTMEIKQKECFCPNFIRYFKMQQISKFARETWEFVNLYSKTRGCNRFLAVEETFRLLNLRSEVKNRNFKLQDIAPLAEWIGKESKLGNPALIEYVKTANSPIMNRILEWSLAVNEDIEKMVFGISPFPFVKDVLQKISGKADAIVVSQTPGEALQREWKENRMEHFVRIIAGQEYGTKTEHLKLAAKGKYADNKILMVGDAPGDMKAAIANGVLFFPVNPGAEDKSWERLNQEALSKFFSGTFEGAYQDGLIDEFISYLPAKPKWN